MIILEEDLLDYEEEEDIGEDLSEELVIYQPTLESYFVEDTTELNPSILLVNNPLWEEAVQEFSRVSIFAFDLETYGAESWYPLHFSRNKIRLIQVGLPDGRCLIADLGGWLDEDKDERLQKYASFLQVLEEKLFDNQVIVVGTNLKFDFTTIRHHFGFKSRQARDLMILSQVFLAGVGVEKAKAGENRSERCKISHGFKAVASRLGFEVDKTEQSSNWGWNLTNSQYNYAAGDVIIALKVYEKFRPLILKEGLAYTAFVECNAVSVFAEMEFRGAPVNRELAIEILKEYTEERDKWVSIFQEHFPDVLWTSTKQLTELFIEQLPGFKELFPEGEKPTVSAEALNQLDHPACQALLYARMLTTAINNIKVYIENSFGGSIRGLYRQIAPGGSGRSTCSAKLFVNRKGYLIGAQLQNPPNMIKEFKGILRPVREIIQAPEGYSFGVFDGAQMHMRIAAELSQDPILLRIFREDFDGHSILASKLANLAGSPWTPEFISGLLKKGPRDERWRRDAQIAYEAANTTPSFDEWLSSVYGTAKFYRDKGKTVLYSCVPLETQCLTKQGWKQYHEVEVGTEILAYNTTTQRNEWTPILQKHFFEDKEVFEWKVGKFKTFRSTKDHRWFGKRRVRNSGACDTSFKYYKDHWFTTESKTTEDIILNTALAESGPGVNLNRLLNKYVEDLLWEDLVLQMTEEERWLFFSANIATDGYQIKNHKTDSYINSCVFTQDVTKQPGLFNAMHLCGYLLGYNVVRQTTAGTTCETLRFASRPTTTCQKPQLKERTLGRQPVWCVTTALDTWVIKQDNYITITGNCLNGSTAGRITSAMVSDGLDWFTLEHGKTLFNEFKEVYSGLTAFIAAQYKKANSTNFNFDGFQTVDGQKLTGSWGRIKTLTGRHIYFKKYPSRFRPNTSEVSYTDSTAANWLLPEADMIKAWSVEVLNLFYENPEWDAYICNLVHDEINVIFKSEFAEVIAPAIRDLMQQVFSKWLKTIPALEEANPMNFICKSWAEK